MADANLLVALNKNKYSGLKNLVLFGRVQAAIEKPTFLSDLADSGTGFFALLDTYAVKCLGEDYFVDNYSGDSNSIYFVKGSMLVYLNDTKLIGENVKVFGAYKNKGVNIRKQFGAKERNAGISAFAFKNQSGSFMIVPNNADILTQGDSVIKGTSLEEFVVSVVINKESKIKYPNTLDSFEEFCGVSNPVIKDMSSTELSLEFDFKPDSEGMIDVSKANSQLVHHFAEDIEESELVDAVQEEIENLSKKRYFYSKDLRTEYVSLLGQELAEGFDPSTVKGYSGTYYRADEITEDIVESFVENIGSKYGKKLPGSKTGFKQFVDELIDNIYKTKWVSDKEKEYSYRQIQECIELLSKNVGADYKLLYGNTGVSNTGGRVAAEIASIPLLRNKTQYATLIVSVVTGISEGDLVGNFNSCNRMYNLSESAWFSILIRNPYLLGLIATGLNIGDCDRIRYSFGKKYNGDIMVERIEELRDTLLLLENMRNSCGKDSFISKTNLLKNMGSYPGIYQKFVLQNGFPCKKDNMLVMETMLGINLSNSFSKSLLRRNPASEFRIKSLYEYKGVLEELNIDGQDYYALSSDIEKEYFIYTRLFKKGQTALEIEDSLIEECISEFEEEKGFKLEALQREGIFLSKCQAAVLSGCAGSGKTTVSDCITKVIKEAFPNKKVLYATPTGKACRRLAEVTGGDVKTLHARFGISVGGFPFLCDVDTRSRSKSEGEKGVVYIFDEMAMCSMDLLFEVVRHLGEDDIVYFLGDIKQLPTIGRGNPFKLLMTFLPCIELGVSKRAAEGSLVNYNTALINNFSDDVIQELKYDSDTFIAVECSDAEIPMKTSAMFLNFMGKGYNEDDIQVITGYQKEDCAFSAPVLSTPIHNALRKADKVLYSYLGKEFCKNERVIHVKRNSYEMPRYIKEGGLTYREVVTFGAMNGEVGRITGMYCSKDVTLIPFDEDAFESENEKDEAMMQLLQLRDEKADSLLDNSKFNSDKIYFVEVAMYDVNLKQDVYMLYHAHTREIGMGETVFEGGDLPNLEYAYALTTHKMQGSQSPVVICAFGSTCNPSFINRNMINTMFTRSQGIVAVVGTVRGADSPINQGRRNASALYCKDMLSLLTGVE